MFPRILPVLILILLVPSLVPSGVYGQQIPAKEGDTIEAEVRGQRAKVKVAPQQECNQKDSSGSYQLAACSSKCQSKFWRWSFWVTNYNVESSFGAGEHQGIGIFGYEYVYDPRFVHADGEAGSWNAKGDVNKFVRIISYPDFKPVVEKALCEQRTTHFRLIYNHGRTLAVESPLWDLATRAFDLGPKLLKAGPARDLFLYGQPITRLSTFTLGPLEYSEWSESNHTEMKKMAATKSCIKVIKDGFCDSVCGNCSYVIPDGLAIGKRENDQFLIANQSTQFDVVFPDPADTGGMGFIKTEKYVRSTTARPHDPFTHCVYDRLQQGDTEPFKPQQALTTRWGYIPGIEDPVITGLWGHNSNTDAEAEFRHFKACAKDPISTDSVKAPGSPSACGACGNPNSLGGKPIQFPCVDGTNEAKTKWFRTEGAHNIDSQAVGEYPAAGKPPMCLTNGEPVHGM